jgi:hypothetical protein
MRLCHVLDVWVYVLYIVRNVSLVSTYEVRTSKDQTESRLVKSKQSSSYQYWVHVQRLDVHLFLEWERERAELFVVYVRTIARANERARRTYSIYAKHRAIFLNSQRVVRIIWYAAQNSSDWFMACGSWASRLVKCSSDTLVVCWFVIYIIYDA